MSEVLSQEVLDFLKERMKQKFSLVRNQHPDRVTAYVQDGLVITEVWSTTNQLILSEEDTVQRVAHLGGLIKDPQVRASMLAFQGNR